jgi:transcriptional regulator with PAS, ATPase and Fis domain
LQVKLLAVLQDRRITRLGGTKALPVDIRVLAATNQDLERMVRAGRFREDLYFRLNVVPIRVPPLRERPEDVPFLLMHFLEEYNRRHRLQVRLDEEVIETLTAYPWPGNVRELMNLVERLLVTAQESRVGLEHLPRKYRRVSSGATTAPGEDLPPLKETVAAFEREMIETALARYGSRELAAHKLGISLSTFNRRLRGAGLVNFDTQN